jgi:hypothetical protein
VQRECAPFIIERAADQITVICRKDIPCYEMKGYYGEILKETGEIHTMLEIPDLKPGEVWKTVVESENQIKIYRRNNDYTGTY